MATIKPRGKHLTPGTNGACTLFAIRWNAERPILRGRGFVFRIEYQVDAGGELTLSIQYDGEQVKIDEPERVRDEINQEVDSSLEDDEYEYEEFCR